MSAALDLPNIEMGATYRHTLFWTNQAKVPIDLTNATARMQIRSDVASPDILWQLTTEDGGILIVPSEGRISLFISAINTALLTTSGGVYDLEVVFSDGSVERLVEGSVAFSPEVTR